ncbi:protein phosphatase 2C domain-containing protein [Ditylenchus destructor]|nr:protein phosphatase 2C domain-containing protein [Ditylenchus destructor]
MTTRSPSGNSSSPSENHETVPPPPRIGMVVDMAAETNVIAELLSAVSGNPATERQQHYAYMRPDFLHFSKEETQLSADHLIRPVLCPKFPLPVHAGYAEVINYGKSQENEDMATAKILNIEQQGYRAEKAIDLVEALKRTSTKPMDVSINEASGSKSNKKLEKRKSDEDILPLTHSFSSDEGPSAPRAECAYFAIFDGHAGSATAIMASKMLHELIKNRLSEVLESILHLSRRETIFGPSSKPKMDIDGTDSINDNANQAASQKDKIVITADSLVAGALEAAFVEMDDQIGSEKCTNRLPGGCATIVTLFFLNKIYVANAGDCRALFVSSNKYQALSNDFSPIRERKRLQAIAYKNREIISQCFSRLEFSRYLTRKDLNHKVLYRDWYMDGWAAKTSRLLNTIGVSRGLGDHHLMTVDDRIAIKPFLSPHPEVQVFDTRSLHSLTEKDVLVMASDGLWDVFSNQEVFDMVNKSLSSSAGDADLDESTRYTLVAQELAAAARGDPVDNCRWKLANGSMASSDDITVFVIPLKFAVNLCAEDGEDDDDEELLDV